MVKFRNSHRSSRSSKSVFGDDPVRSFTEDQPYARFVIGAAKEIVNGCKEKLHLPRVLRFERRQLQIDDQVAAQFQVLGEQVKTKNFATNFKRILAADKRKCAAQLKNKLLNVLDESDFEFAFVSFCGEHQKIKVVGVFQKLLREIGLWRGECPLKIGDCLPLPTVKTGHDVGSKNISAPTVFHGRLRVPNSFFRASHKIEQPDVVAPRKLSNHRLDNCFVLSSLATHPPQIVAQASGTLFRNQIALFQLQRHFGPDADLNDPFGNVGQYKYNAFEAIANQRLVRGVDMLQFSISASAASSR